MKFFKDIAFIKKLIIVILLIIILILLVTGRCSTMNLIRMW
ncbi:hypothetical protein [Sedimentibacter hydroxybenzoicus]|nr:hypothetical protein [Sedimentibacter hydroxybenzoicus]